MNKLPESDWKLISKHKDIYLQKLCSRINGEILGKMHEKYKTDYDRYIAIYKLIQSKDRRIGEIFDLWRRSKFYDLMVEIIAEGLYGPEIQKLSTQTKGLLSDVYGIDPFIFECPF